MLVGIGGAGFMGGGGAEFSGGGGAGDIGGEKVGGPISLGTSDGGGGGGTLGGGSRFGTVGGFIFSLACGNGGLLGNSGMNVGGPNSAIGDIISLWNNPFSPSTGDNGTSDLGGFGGGTFLGPAALGSVCEIGLLVSCGSKLSRLGGKAGEGFGETPLGAIGGRGLVAGVLGLFAGLFIRCPGLGASFGVGLGATGMAGLSES